MSLCRAAAPPQTLRSSMFCIGIMRRAAAQSLKNVGTHRYAADPSTEILCVAYAVDDGPVQLWLPGNPVPPEFLEAAHNPTLDRRRAWRSFRDRDRAACAGAAIRLAADPARAPPMHDGDVAGAGLPARLSAAADALELANRKDAAGERLMHQMSKPRRARQDEDPAGTYWFDDPERLDRLYAYCRQDVEVERELYDRLPPLPPDEQAMWVLSSKINERGFCVDRKFAEAARRIAQAAAPEIDPELAEITGGAVTGINQIARLHALAAASKAVRSRNLIARRSRSCCLIRRSAAARCSGCWSSGLAARRLQSRKSMRCWPAPAMTIACAAPSAITAPPPAAGPAKVSSRKT